VAGYNAPMSRSASGFPRPHAPLVYRAREVLVAFLFTFIAARVLVYLIMSRRMPNLNFHMGETHVHHLNYGIFILSFVGAFLIFGQPKDAALSITSFAYGVGLALTFDEFGMWLHLGGPYWQRASFDAIVVIAAVLSLFAAAPTLRRFRPQHWATTAALAIALAAFGYALVDGARHFGKRIAPRFQQLEQNGPR